MTLWRAVLLGLPPISPIGDISLFPATPPQFICFYWYPRHIQCHCNLQSSGNLGILYCAIFTDAFLFVLYIIWCISWNCNVLLQIIPGKHKLFSYFTYVTFRFWRIHIYKAIYFIFENTLAMAVIKWNFISDKMTFLSNRVFFECKLRGDDSDDIWHPLYVLGRFLTTVFPIIHEVDIYEYWWWVLRVALTATDAIPISDSQIDETQVLASLSGRHHCFSAIKHPIATTSAGKINFLRWEIVGKRSK